MWATSVSISVFLGLSVLDVGQMYLTDRHQTSSDVRRASSLNAHHSTGKVISLQCFDTVGRVTGRAFGLQSLAPATFKGFYLGNEE